MFCRVLYDYPRFLAEFYIILYLQRIERRHFGIRRIFTLRILFDGAELYRGTRDRSSRAFIRTSLYIMPNSYRGYSNLVFDTAGVDINKFYVIRCAPCIITILLPYLNIIYCTVLYATTRLI